MTEGKQPGFRGQDDGRLGALFSMAVLYTRTLFYVKHFFSRAVITSHDPSPEGVHNGAEKAVKRTFLSWSNRILT